MPKHLLTASAIALLTAMPLAADEITDTLQSAIEAYEDGDVQYALDELEIAKQKLNRVLVRISGADVDTMLAALEEMDFKAMASFGQ